MTCRRSSVLSPIEDSTLITERLGDERWLQVLRAHNSLFRDQVRAHGGYELARYWHFLAVWTFIGFTVVHVVLVFAVDPTSFRSMITGRYRGRFPNHD